MSHTDYVADAPAGFQTHALTAECPVAAMADEKRRLYGVQFHPEVEHTPFGRKMLSNFLFDICG
jgi:GMP synthase (glutamine-hydrolysing)